MTIDTLRKKATWEIRVMIKALSQPISSFLNTDEDNQRLEDATLVLKERKKIMTIDKNAEGAWRICENINGYLETQVYYFYT